MVEGVSARQNLRGTAPGTVLIAGGDQQHVSSVAVVSGVTVLAGGTQVISRDGSVNSGGSSVDAHVLSVGFMVVRSVGSSSGSVVQTIGHDWIVAFGVDNGAMISGEGARQDVRGCGSDTVVWDGDQQHLSAGA